MAKLKIFKELIFYIVIMIAIDFFASKVFETEFSIHQDILIGIVVYIGGYSITKKKK